MAKFIVPLFILAFFESEAQSASKLMGSKAAGMGYASATSHDEWAMFNNIAGLAKQKESFLTMCYEVRPALPSANRIGMSLSTPLSFGVIGVSVFRFGDDLYSEQLVALGFANKIGNTSLGGRISYIQYRAEGFGTHGVIGLDFGGITQLTKQLFIGAWIQNLNQPRLKFNNEEKAPIKLFATLAFKPSEKFTISTELEKDVFYPVLWKTGMEYAIYKKIFARLGFNLNPNSMFAGVGFESWRIKIDYALQAFTKLSASHQASASYKLWNANAKKARQ